MNNIREKRGKKMTDQKVIEIVTAQEEALVFDHFTNADAWDLGCALVEEAKATGAAPAIQIKLMSGYTVFQYGFDGTCLNHEHWLIRKERTARLHNASTMKVGYLLSAAGAKMEDWYMDSMEYSTCPGAFPINVKGVGVVGFILVSGISILADHDMIIGALIKYLGVEGVERIQD